MFDEYAKKLEELQQDVPKIFEKVAKKVEFFANKEGLGAHAKSAVIRFENNEKA